MPKTKAKGAAKKPGKSPTKKKSNPGSPGKKKSNPKKEMTSPARKKKLAPPSRERPVPTLKVYAFPAPFTFEAYIYETNPHDDGFNNMITKYLRGEFAEVRHTEFDAANFTRQYWRRIPGTANEHLTNMKDVYWRKIQIRYPRGGESTGETRQEGLDAFKSFLMDRRFQYYPPEDIVLLDMTDEENYSSLDQFFMDRDIETVMKEDIPEQQLNPTFHQAFPEFATKCFGLEPYGDFARSLGFGA